MADTATEERTEEARAPAEDSQAPPVETPQPQGTDAQAAEPRATQAQTPEPQAPGAGAAGPEADAEQGPAAEAERARPMAVEEPGEAAGESDDQGYPARTIEFLGSLELEASAELGRARLSIGEVLKLRPGSVVSLEKMLGDPAELMIKDRLIARGEVVVVDDRFGLRITEVLSRESE